MKFRPCIDIHNGKVKQIVGGSLQDEGDQAAVNFASRYDADYYARLYRRDGLSGGHVILLNPLSSIYYEETLKQAEKALRAYPGGLQLGGGVTADNAASYLEMGASHVIVTSYVFREGKIQWDKINKLKNAVGKERIVIDVSCRKKEGDYYIVTDRWQTYTDVKLTKEILGRLERYCDEFLVHGVDVEGKAAGIDRALVSFLGTYEGIPVTYAGGIGSFEDLKLFEEFTKGRVDVTIGSALDLFGGTIPYEQVKAYRAR